MQLRWRLPCLTPSLAPVSPPADAQHVMQFMQQMQGVEMDADDPTSGYMLQAGARLCKCLGQEFLPYMDVVMPPLLRSALLEPDVKVRPAAYFINALRGYSECARVVPAAAALHAFTGPRPSGGNW